MLESQEIDDKNDLKKMGVGGWRKAVEDRDMDTKGGQGPTWAYTCTHNALKSLLQHTSC